MLYHLICLSANFTTCSTGRSGFEVKMSETTFAEGAGENPNMVKAPTASSFTAVFMFEWLSAETLISDVMPSETILSFKSIIIS